MLVANFWQPTFYKKLVMKHYYLIVLALLMVRCTKDNVNDKPITKVSGYVVSTGSQKPIEGVKVKMYDGIYNTDKNNIDSVLTDKDGRFSISLKASEPVLYLSKQGYVFEYHLEGAVMGIMPLNPGTSLSNIKLNLDAVAYFNPVLMNKVPQNNDDYIIIYLFGRYDGPMITNNFAGNGPFKFYPYNNAGILILGDSYSKYKLIFLRNGLQNTIFDSVYIAPQQLYTDTIYY
jgi:hypothetical protein